MLALSWAMARLARVIAPGVPHHLSQRGNRRQRSFFSDDRYRTYRALMAEWWGRHEVAVWAYCLMPNHVHLIMVPASADGLRRAVGEAHRRCSRGVNLRQGWRGHLWQGRFDSFPLDGRHLLAAARYVELNPVRARLVEGPEAWPWSSAAEHLVGRDDGLVSAAPLLDMAADWRAFLAAGARRGGGRGHAPPRAHRPSPRRGGFRRRAGARPWPPAQAAKARTEAEIEFVGRPSSVWCPLNLKWDSSGARIPYGAPLTSSP